MASNDNLAGEFIARCFHARTAAHILHLKSKSYAEHKALNEFYDEIIDLTDDFAEMYQGEQSTIIQTYPDGYRTPSSPLVLISGLQSWVENNRKNICDSQQCQAQIDVILMLCNQTFYKLKFLK